MCIYMFIYIGVKYYEEFLQRMPRDEAAEMERIVMHHAQQLLPGRHTNMHIYILKYSFICFHEFIDKHMKAFIQMFM
jgi:hypothetical protein